MPQVILEQYRVKHRVYLFSCSYPFFLIFPYLFIGLKAAHVPFYKPFPELHSWGPYSDPGALEIEHLENLLNNSRWRQTRQSSETLMDTTLKGLRYLQTCVTITFC